MGVVCARSPVAWGMLVMQAPGQGGYCDVWDPWILETPVAGLKAH